MEKITISIETVNSAFEENEKDEVIRILHNLIHQLEEGNEPTKLRDINGNTVGFVEYE